MIKVYRSVVNAEQFDGSVEMMSRYSIKKVQSPLGFDYVIKKPVVRSSRNQWLILLVGDYLITTSSNEIFAMDSNTFERLYAKEVNYERYSK